MAPFRKPTWPQETARTAAGATRKVASWGQTFLYRDKLQDKLQEIPNAAPQVDATNRVVQEIPLRSTDPERLTDKLQKIFAEENSFRVQVNLTQCQQQSRTLWLTEPLIRLDATRSIPHYCPKKALPGKAPVNTGLHLNLVQTLISHALMIVAGGN